MTLCFELVGIGHKLHVISSRTIPPLKALGTARSFYRRFQQLRLRYLGRFEKPHSVSIKCPAEPYNLRFNHLWRFRLPRHTGHFEKTLFPKAKFAFQGSYYHNGCLARNWHPASKSNGKYFVARSVFPKCICPDGRIFNLCDWRIFKRWVVYIDYPDVYRSFSGVYGWWYQN